MLEDIEKLLIDGNFQFQSKIFQNRESFSFDQKIPKYPILFLTCMDPRIDVHQIFQFNPGDVFILRNAGNVYTIDMMRSILIAIYKYKIKYIIVLGHLDCGMTKINIMELRKKLPNEFLKRFSINYSDLLSKLSNFFKPFDNEIRNIIEQMNDLQEIKVYFPDVEITGMLYDIKSGWIFTKEDFRDLLIEEDHFKIYRGLLSEKSQQLSKFLEAHDVIKKAPEELVNGPQINEINFQEENCTLEKEEKNIADIVDIDFKKAVDDDKEGFQLKMPKIQIPKIYIPELKIHIPRSFKNKDR